MVSIGLLKPEQRRGMVIGTWDARPGYGDLIPGSNDWSTNQQAIETMIASSDHIADYWGADRTAPPPLHADDCLADFMGTSRDPFADGYSPFGTQDDGLVGYADYRGYVGPVAVNTTYDANDLWTDDTYWGAFCSEIDAGRPVELYVDSDADGGADHYITAYGYDPAAKQYIGYDPSSSGEKRYDFARNAPGQAFGLRGATFLDMVPEPATVVLVGSGVVLGLAGRRNRR